MPMEPLLLVSRVMELEGQKGQLGAARIVTEYDLPRDAAWSVDGRPPPCVMVESGQADLFLVSWLGIDELCRGERVYRLLDCDLCFQSARPLPGAGLTARRRGCPASADASTKEACPLLTWVMVKRSKQPPQSHNQGGRP